MNRFSLFVLMLAALFWTGCQNDDDDNGNCPPYELEWHTPSLQSGENWLFLSDESGTLLSETTVEGQDVYRLSLNDCRETVNVNFLATRMDSVKDGGVLRTETFLELTTILDAPSGLVWDTLAQPPKVKWDIAIANVSSLESLLWPAESKEIFGGDIFLDPAANLLSFSIQVPEGWPAYLTIQANGDAQPRGVWIASAEEGQLTFDYNQLMPLVEQGPVALPNGSNWRFAVHGEGPSGEAMLDYASLPDFVSGAFNAQLPASGPEALRLQAWENRNFQDFAYSVHLSDQAGLANLPAAIQLPASGFSLERAADSLRVRAMSAGPTVYVLELTDYRGPGPWLRWTIYGSPSSMENFVLPNWPMPLEGTRSSLLANGRQTVAVLTAKQYASGATYSQFIEALAAKDTLWESRQGLLQRSNVSGF